LQQTTSIDVVWTPGTESVPAVVGQSFAVVCVTNGAPCPPNPTFNINRPVASTTTTVAGLNAGATYDCYAIAKNWDGNAVCSSKSAVTLNKDSGKPTITSTTCPPSVDAIAATISLVATTAGSPATSIDVTWTAGTDSSPAATGATTFYVGCVASAGATCPTGVTFNVARPAPTTTTIVGGLTPGTSYVCYVVAKNWNGAEVCSTVSSAVTTAAGTSAVAPTISSVVSSVDGVSGIVTWSPGAASVPAAADPSFYVACVAGAGAACPTGVTFDVARPAATTMTAVGGLMPGTSYACYVVAKDWNGAEVCSSPVVFNASSVYRDGVTVICPGIAVGGIFTLGGKTYTRRNQDGLTTLVDNGAGGTGWDLLSTSCTTGVTSMNGLFKDRSQDLYPGIDTRTFNADIRSWDTAAVTDMVGMFNVRAPRRLLFRCRCFLAVYPSLPPGIDAHVTRPSVPRCTVVCQFLQPAHR